MSLPDAGGISCLRLCFISGCIKLPNEVPASSAPLSTAEIKIWDTKVFKATTLESLSDGAISLALSPASRI